MVPPEFITFYVTCAQAAAALIGLLFVAVSIAPEVTVTADAPPARQGVAASAFTALVLAFFISLTAQIPHTNIGVAITLIGAFGVVATLTLLRTLLRAQLGPAGLLRALVLVAISAGVYAAVAWQGVQLARAPSGVGPLYTLDGLLTTLFGVGLIRAWQLLGAALWTFRWLAEPAAGHASETAPAPPAPPRIATQQEPPLAGVMASIG